MTKQKKRPRTCIYQKKSLPLHSIYRNSKNKYNEKHSSNDFGVPINRLRHQAKQTGKRVRIYARENNLHLLVLRR